MFFVSVASKGLRYCASPLFATYTKWPISVVSKGLRLHRNRAHFALVARGRWARGQTKGLRTIVPRSYCTRGIWDRQEESPGVCRSFVAVGGCFTRYVSIVLRWRWTPV